MKHNVHKCTAAGFVMNWDDLRLFLAVARTGTISGAAKLLDVQHSTVSRRMRQLEEKMGARLIERKNSGYKLTTAGKKVKLAAKKMEAEVLHVDGIVTGKDANVVGTLKVTAINNMASSVLMPMFASFSQAYPLVDLHVIVSNMDTSLAQREADVAIRLTNSPTETLIGKRMVTVASTVYGSPQYLAKLRTNNMEPKWIGVECCSFHKSWTKQSCGDQPHNFYCDDTLLTLAAIKEGLGVAYLPCFMGDADPMLERFCAPDPVHDLGLWILLHPDLKRTARVLAFKNHINDSVCQNRDVFEGNINK